MASTSPNMRRHLAKHRQAVVNHVYLGPRVMHPAHRIPLPQMEFAWMRNHRESLRQCARTRESHPQNRVMLSPLVWSGA